MMRTQLQRAAAPAAFALLVLVSGPAGAAGRATPLEAGSGRPDPASRAASQAERHAELLGQRVDAGVRRPLRAAPSDAALAEIAADRSPRRMVGAMVATSASAAFDPAVAGFGAARDQRDGWVWTGAIESPGATALRIRFSELYLPRGAELFVYTEDGQVRGPYTGRGPGGRGDFLSHTVFGSSALVQVRYAGEDGPRARSGASLTVAGVAHMTERFTFGALQAASDQEAFCNFNESCVENAECSSIPGAIQAAQDAVAHMLFQSGAFLYICSGGLLADTDPGSAIPYFLTANHCISKNNEAASLEAFFQFATPCNGSCYDPDGAVPSTLGSSIVSKGRNTDYTLLQLSEPAPGGSAFLGWNATEVAFTDGVDLYRVSHPAGAPQAYSEHVVDAGAPTCAQWNRGDRIYSRDVYGATEGGSSGSPVLNSAGQVVGQLSGACGTNVNETCDAESNATVDGAFAAYFDEVAPFLDPNTTCTDGDGDGFCAEGDDCDDSDPGVNPLAAEVCTDGIDNDCDGQVDGADPDCGTCSLGQQGDPCDSDAQCCSNKCKGKPGEQTCR